MTEPPAIAADLAVQSWPIERVKPYRKNPRKIPDSAVAAVARSIEAYGWRQPIVVDKAGVVIVGHVRRLAAVKLGLQSVPVHVAEGLTREQVRAYRLMDNRSAEDTTWDNALLGDELADLLDVGFDLELTGFGADLALIAENRQSKNRGSAPDVIPEEPAVPVTQPGDLWRLGDHLLLRGDSFDEAERRRLVPATVAAVVTDPPYAVYGSSTGIAADIADDKMVRPFFADLFRLIVAVLPDFGHAYVFTDWRSWSAVWEQCRRAGITAKNLLVWDKGGSGLGSNYANTYELVGFFARLPKQTAMGNRPAGQRQVHKPNVLRYNRPHGDDRQHNAAKPVELLRELIENSTDAGDLVADFFGGSGSTLIACEAAGRACRMAEIEPAMCDTIVERWQTYAGRAATLEEDGRDFAVVGAERRQGKRGASAE